MHILPDQIERVSVAQHVQLSLDLQRLLVDDLGLVGLDLACASQNGCRLPAPDLVSMGNGEDERSVLSQPESGMVLMAKTVYGVVVGLSRKIEAGLDGSGSGLQYKVLPFADEKPQSERFALLYHI